MERIVRTLDDLITQLATPGTTGTFLPGAGGDDGQVYDPTFDSSSSYFSLGNYDGSRDDFIRFPNVTIPQGATITAAKLTFLSFDSKSTTTCSVRIYGNDADNAAAPTDVSEFSALVLTDAYVDWSDIGSWSYDSHDSPDIKAVIQEIVNRAGWSSGNALQLVIKDNGSTSNARRNARSYDGAGNDAQKPTLTVTWTE